MVALSMIWTESPHNMQSELATRTSTPESPSDLYFALSVKFPCGPGRPHRLHRRCWYLVSNRKSCKTWYFAEVVCLPAACKRHEAMKTLKSATDNRIAKTVGADKPPDCLGQA